MRRPGAFLSSVPVTARIESRISSAERRRGLCRQIRRFAGSTATAAGEALAARAYDRLRTIDRTRRLIDQPSCTNWLARWSSNSGCDGVSPVVPKLSTDRTSPSSKRCCQTRLTITRDVSGFAGLVSQVASSNRPLCLASGLATFDTLTRLRNPRKDDRPELFRPSAADAEFRC